MSSNSFSQAVSSSQVISDKRGFFASLLSLPLLGAAMVAFALAVFAAPAARAADDADSGDKVEFATPSDLSSHDLLLAATMAGKRMIAVGQFGHVIYSDDGGITWVQAKEVPTQVTLTSVYFVNDKVGYAGGHDGTVIRTDDGGVTWGKKPVYHNVESQSPIMTVFFTDENHGFAMGAFSFMVETSDGGKTWTQREIVPDSDRHLNKAFAGKDGVILVAAESGKVFRSADHGVTFTEIQTEYDGSFWGGMTLKNGSSLVYGMRGNAYRSDDAGQTWYKIDSGTDKSIGGGWELDNGTVVLVGLQGYVGYSTDGAKTFTEVTRADRLGYVAVLPAANDQIAVFGEPGVKLQSDNAEKAADEVGFKFNTGS